jgi:four helix bundle protein
MHGARHFSELTVWKLADELRIETLKLTGRPACARNFKAQTQAEDAVNSICRNIAEGFGCESHGQFAWYLRVSRRSLNELQDAFRGAEQKGYVSSDDRAPLRALTRRLYPALNRFIAYLDSTPDYRPPRRSTKPRPLRPPPEPPRTNPRSGDRIDERSPDRTDSRSGARTDRRSGARTDERSGPRTDKRSSDRTDPRKNDRTS